LVFICSPSNLDAADHPPGFGTFEVKLEEAVFQPGSGHFHAIRQHEGARELAGRDAAVQVGPSVFLLLAAADHQLVLLDRHVQLVAAEAGDGERDAQPFGLALGTGQALL
jgi:hypothetical protein